MSSSGKGKSMAVGLFKDSSRAIANGLSLAGVQIVDKAVFDKKGFKDVNYKHVLMDSAIMMGATFGTGIINSSIMANIKLPHFIQKIEAQYSVDIVTVLLYVGIEMLMDKLVTLENYEKKGFLVSLFEAISAILLGSYIDQPINAMFG